MNFTIDYDKIWFLQAPNSPIYSICQSEYDTGLVLITAHKAYVLVEDLIKRHQYEFRFQNR